MKSTVYVVGLMTSVATFLVACSGDYDSAKRKKFFGPGAGGEYTTVDVEAASTAQDGMFALAGEAVQTMTLKVSCDGIAEEVVPPDDEFELPVGARNCKAKLVSIKLGEKTYVEPAAGLGFSHYLKNDAAKFANQADAKDVIYVKVKEQLPSPLTANPSVKYVYSAVTQFDTVDAENAAIDATAKTLGVAAPEVKVSKAFIGPNGGLNVHIECTAAGGFEGTLLENLKCGGSDVKTMKFGVALNDETAAVKDTDLAKVKTSLIADLKGAIYIPSAKVINLNFGVPKERKTHILVASRTSGTATSYAYGFIRLGGTKVLDIGECAAQGTQANFVQDAVHLGADNRGHWRDTSNCWVWQRVITDKVKSVDRFKQCPAIKAGEQVQHRTLPYFTEMKAARDRNIHVLAKGVAPALGANIDQETFWLAGGRVFNMKDGSVRAVKDIKPNEKHNVLCVTKRD